MTSGKGVAANEIDSRVVDPVDVVDDRVIVQVCGKLWMAGLAASMQDVVPLAVYGRFPFHA